MKSSIAVLTLLVLVGIFLVRWLPVEREPPSLFPDQAALLTPLLLDMETVPSGSQAESADPLSQNFSLPPVPPKLLELPQPAVQEATGPLPVPSSVQPAVSALPVSFIYFDNRCVRVVPTRTVPIVYTSGLPPIAPLSVAVPAPVMVPIFVPQIVPSRVGVPKWVYPNGVIIKPQVYYYR